jgi:hypothetical protein
MDVQHYAGHHHPLVRSTFCCYTVATLLSYCCYTVVILLCTLLCHCWYTVGTLLLTLVALLSQCFAGHHHPLVRSTLFCSNTLCTPFFLSPRPLFNVCCLVSSCLISVKFLFREWFPYLVLFYPPLPHTLHLYTLSILYGAQSMLLSNNTIAITFQHHNRYSLTP